MLFRESVWRNLFRKLEQLDACVAEDGSEGEAEDKEGHHDGGGGGLRAKGKIRFCQPACYCQRLFRMIKYGPFSPEILDQTMSISQNLSFLLVGKNVIYLNEDQKTSTRTERNSRARHLTCDCPSGIVLGANIMQIVPTYPVETEKATMRTR